MKFYIGTSGWSYDDWTGIFYKKKSENRLKKYQEEFGAVEINSSFYRIFKKSVFEKWKNETGKSFIFTAKINRLFTHLRKLDVDEKLCGWFFESVSGLEGKLKVILVQVPPTLKCDPGRLKDFLSILKKHTRCGISVEPRHESWYSPVCYDIFRKYKVSLCWSDTGGKYPSKLVKTCDFLYIRLHGPRELYSSLYTSKELNEIFDRICSVKDGIKRVYIFFDNTYNGYAVWNAREMKKICCVSGNRIAR